MGIYEGNEISEDDVSREEEQRVAILMPYYDLKRSIADPHSALALIIDKARADAIAANKALIRCNPFQGEIIRALQWRCRRFNALMDYIESIKEGGEEAVEDLSEEQQAEMQRLLGEAEAQDRDV